MYVSQCAMEGEIVQRESENGGRDSQGEREMQRDVGKREIERRMKERDRETYEIESYIEKERWGRNRQLQLKMYKRERENHHTNVRERQRDRCIHIDRQ